MNDHKIDQQRVHKRNRFSKEHKILNHQIFALNLRIQMTELIDLLDDANHRNIVACFTMEHPLFTEISSDKPVIRRS